MKRVITFVTVSAFVGVLALGSVASADNNIQGCLHPDKQCPGYECWTNHDADGRKRTSPDQCIKPGFSGMCGSKYR